MFVGRSQEIGAIELQLSSLINDFVYDLFIWFLVDFNEVSY